jgi:uncharacterized protein (TIGR03435 family)
MMMKVAYGVKTDSQVLQLPDWASKEHFDFSAKLDDPEFKKLDHLTGEAQEAELQLLIQSLLAERFHIVAHLEKKTLPVFFLLPVKTGARLTPSKPVPPKDDGTPGEPSHNTSVHDGHMEAQGAEMSLLAKILSDRYETGKRVVLDHTGLPGFYDFTLDWSPDRGTGISPEATRPDLMTALGEQLGLRLEKQEAEVPVLIIESLSRPEFD